MEIKREYYLDKLIKRQNNGLIKVITGIRRCGKSYLLNTLFYNYLLDYVQTPYFTEKSWYTFCIYNSKQFHRRCIWQH